jgi:hypothetical protein
MRPKWEGWQLVCSHPESPLSCTHPHNLLSSLERCQGLLYPLWSRSGVDSQPMPV